jgi:hypothetical protein
MPRAKAKTVIDESAQDDIDSIDGEMAASTASGYFISKISWPPVTFEKLTGAANFREWETRIKGHIRMAGAAPYFIKPPTDAAKYAEWSVINDQISGLICQTVSSSISSKIIDKSVALEMLEYLQEKYKTSTSHQFNFIIGKLTSLKYKKGSDPQSFIDSFESILDELSLA